MGNEICFGVGDALYERYHYEARSRDWLRGGSPPDDLPAATRFGRATVRLSSSRSSW
jgi:hypothetical protein